MAAEYVGTSKAYLDQGRSTGSGPPFIRISRTLVLYRRVDLDEWLGARRVSTTAEADRVDLDGWLDARRVSTTAEADHAGSRPDPPRTARERGGAKP